MPEPRPPEEWSDERRAALRREVARRRERATRAGRWVGLALAAVVAVGVVFRLPASWWIPAVGAVALAGLVARLVHWSCPACGERLPTRGSATSCRGCGLPLD
jgi:fatty acid desaturase